MGDPRRPRSLAATFFVPSAKTARCGARGSTSWHLTDRPALRRPGGPLELRSTRRPPLVRPHLLRRPGAAQTDSVSPGPRQAGHHRPLCQQKFGGAVSKVAGIS